MKTSRIKVIAFTTALLAAWVSTTAQAQASVTPAEARAIAKEAYIYGFPMVDHYRIQYSYFQDRSDSNYKTAWNQLINIPRVFTPQDTAIQTPNSDTRYSFIGMDLRAEPMVITVPKIDKKRYFSVQLIDAYTEAGYETAYIGKWHMGETNGAPRSGFDFWMSHRGQGRYFDNEWNINGRRELIKGYYTTVVTDRAVKWLNRPHNKPFCLVVGQKAPHGGPIEPEPK